MSPGAPIWEVEKQLTEFSLAYCGFLRTILFREKKQGKKKTQEMCLHHIAHSFPGKINQSCVYFPGLLYMEMRILKYYEWCLSASVHMAPWTVTRLFRITSVIVPTLLKMGKFFNLCINILSKWRIFFSTSYGLFFSRTTYSYRELSNFQILKYGV